MIYLDYQATTPLAPQARDAMLPWLSGTDDAAGGYANPSSQYRSGRTAAVAVELAREAVAALLPKGGRVVFTSGATEALNWALFKSAQLRPGGTIGTEIEHAAGLQCLEALHAESIPVGEDGVADAPAWLPESGIVSMMLVNNEIGTIQPVEAFAEAAHDCGSWLVCDAVQGFGRLWIPEGPDMIAVSAHKIHGPKGIGALWIRDGIDLPPLILGGAQEGGLRSGTVSPALCAGFGAAANLAADRMNADAAHVALLWDVATEMFAGWTINGSTAHRYKGNLNIRRDGVNATRLLSDVRDVAFSLGSACGSGSGRTSHVLRALGLTEQQARSSIRLGWGRYTSEDDLRTGLGAILSATAAQGIN
ncbi:Cysteine desulfurase [Sphingomonas antarctica]|uniref:cysteine desulfurase family protein n=1 Tax=Sphingomonas antarctica TaxID=2040274 RepID=UPI0039EB5845